MGAFMKSRHQISNVPNPSQIKRDHHRRIVAQLLGLPDCELSQAINRIKKGFSLRQTQTLLTRLDLDEKALMQICEIRLNNVRRRKQRRLTWLESARLYRLIKLYAMTVELFEDDHRAAITWLKTPNPALWDKTPLQCATMLPGYEEVEQLIGRLDRGIF